MNSGSVKTNNLKILVLPRLAWQKWDRNLGNNFLS